MEHLALYRQFRPMTFDEVVEQKHVVSTLRQSVASGQIAHAYLFSGTRGTGKTSVAKILSRAINCENPNNGNPCNQCEICMGILDGSIMDVIEMDAASNNSVDNIRRICDEVLFMPSRARYKVYIVDEVHMLSTGAFNALLKTLEEPPQHAVFILATTEPHRIPATIVSRCQRYDFRRIPFEAIIDRLRHVSECEGISIGDDALEAIAKLSDGALRDAISLLDQVSTNASSVIARDDILKMTGVVDDRFLLSMADSILSGNSVAIIDLCDQLIMDGRDILRFTLDLARYFRDLLVIGISKRPETLVRATTDSLIEMRQLSDRTSKDALLSAITRLSELASELKWSPDMRTSFEIALLSLGASNAENSAANTMSQESGTLKSEPDKSDSTASIPPGLVTPESTSPATTAPESGPTATIAPESVPPETVAPDSGPPEPEVPASAIRTSFVLDSDFLAPPETNPGEASAQLTIQTFSHIPDEKPRSAAVDYSKIAPLTPNLTRATEPQPPVYRPATNLSKVTSVPPVRDANIPLPPVIPDDGVEEPKRNEAPTGEALSVSHLWNILIKRWEDTMLLDSLQLRHARPELREPDLYLIFPDIMRSYIDQLTQRTEYKRIKEDALALISGVREVRLFTDSEVDQTLNSDSKNGELEGKVSTQPDWVGHIKAYAKQNNIEIETADDR